MFAHQSRHAVGLLKKYGNEICLHDATYKTTLYKLPWFFLVVKTNMDYQVVAAFLIEGEIKENVIAALAIIKERIQILICFTQWSVAVPGKTMRWKLFILVNTCNDIAPLGLIRLLKHSILFKNIYIKGMHRTTQKVRYTGKVVNEKSDETSHN